MKLRILALAAISAAALPVTASAHHSFAMFDATKTVTMNGTVKEFEWVNPHSWIRLMVADQAGAERQWALEMGSPGQNAQRGWTPTTLKPGDKISVVMHPLKDGSRGGQFMSATLPNGQTLGNGGRPNNAQGE